MGQDVISISIDNETLECVNTFTYLGSTMSSDLSLNTELNSRFARAAAVMSTRVWTNNHLTLGTKLQVYLPNLCHQHPAVWQRGLVNLHQT